MSARWLASAALVVLAGCHTTTPVGPLVPSQGLQGSPAKIEIVHRDGSKETLRSPAVVGDSLVGFRRTGASGDSVRVAYPLSDIRSAQEREFSGTRTVGAIAAFSLAAAVVLLITASIALSNTMSHKS